MDKEEYRIRLETIRTMAAQQDFGAAVQVADTIDWRRVKSVRTLCMIEEIYEAADRYEDAKKVLQCAYWRAHTSKTVLYRLTEINIKTGDFSEALKYCDEFELLSPKDETKYLLRYKLLTARGDSVDARIRVLEAYRETKFTEKWAYELATLYQKSGQDEKCAQLCDDMIAWFPDGKYRQRARELKDKVRAAAPAAETPKELKTAPRRQETTEIKVEPPKRRPERPISEDAFRRTEDSAVKTQLADSWRTLVSGIRTEEPAFTVPETVIGYPGRAETPAAAAGKVKDLEPETIGRTTIAPPQAEREEGGVQITIDDIMGGSAPSGEEEKLDELLSETSAHLANAVASGQYDRIRTQETSRGDDDVPAGQMSFDDFMPEMQDEEAEEMDPLARLYGKETDESLGLTKSYSIDRDVVKEIARQEKQKASDEAEKRRRRAVEQTLRSAGVIKENTGDLWAEKNTAEEAGNAEVPEAEKIVTTPEAPEKELEMVLPELEKPVKEAPARETEKAAPSDEDETPDSESIEEMLREAEEEDEPVIRAPRRKQRADFGSWLGRILRQEDDEDEEESSEETEDDEEDAEEETAADIRPVKRVVKAEPQAVVPKKAEPEETEAEEAEEAEPEETETEEAENETEAEDSKAVEEAAEEESGETEEEEEEIPKKKKRGFLSFFKSLRVEDDDEAEEEAEEDEAEEDEAAESVTDKGDAGEEDLSWIDEAKGEAEQAAQTDGAEERADRAVSVRTENAGDKAEAAEAEAASEEETGVPEEAQTAKQAIFAEEAPAEEEQADPIIEAIASQPETIRRLPVEPRPFDETEKELFSYFTKVPGMSEQITMALADVHNNAGDKTSRSGNIMVIGRQGSGKTHLTDAIMAAVCRDLGIRETRCAKIVASEFNQKNPAEIVSKLMGGFLVIEGAGELTDEAAEKLLRAMEFRTDHLIVMLEDEKADLKALLLRHPEIEEKFTSTIVIPVFTNDELVTFAKAYAREKGYRMDEMGILALYTMIGDNQSATEPVTVGKVKGMMDAAMEKADRGARKLKRHFSKKAVDREGRILLHEKDFDY